MWNKLSNLIDIVLDIFTAIGVVLVLLYVTVTIWNFVSLAQSNTQLPIPPTVQQTPDSTLTTTPTPNYYPTTVILYQTETIYVASEISAQDVLFLASLCTVETKSFEDKRIDACESVVSTVLTRMEKNLLSDGTVRGTITWNCGPEDKECQLPAYAVNGCEGIAGSICPYNYPHHLIEFVGVVEDFLKGGQEAECQGYLFYGLKGFDEPECRIEEGSWFINFHNGLN